MQFPVVGGLGFGAAEPAQTLGSCVGDVTGIVVVAGLAGIEDPVSTEVLMVVGSSISNVLVVLGTSDDDTTVARVVWISIVAEEIVPFADVDAVSIMMGDDITAVEVTDASEGADVGVSAVDDDTRFAEPVATNSTQSKHPKS